MEINCEIFPHGPKKNDKNEHIFLYQQQRLGLRDCLSFHLQSEADTIPFATATLCETHTDFLDNRFTTTFFFIRKVKENRNPFLRNKKSS